MKIYNLRSLVTSLGGLGNELQKNVEFIMSDISKYFYNRDIGVLNPNKNLKIGPIILQTQNEFQPVAVKVTLESKTPRLTFDLTFSAVGTIKIEYIASHCFLYGDKEKENYFSHLSLWPRVIIDRFQKTLVGFSKNSLTTGFVSCDENIQAILDSIEELLTAEDVSIK